MRISECVCRYGKSNNISRSLLYKLQSEFLEKFYKWRVLWISQSSVRSSKKEGGSARWSWPAA